MPEPEGPASNEVLLEVFREVAQTFLDGLKCEDARGLSLLHQKLLCRMILLLIDDLEGR